MDYYFNDDPDDEDYYKSLLEKDAVAGMEANAPALPNDVLKEKQSKNTPSGFKYASMFENIPYAKGNVDYLEGKNFGRFGGEAVLRDTIFPFLQSRAQFRAGPDTAITQTKRGQELKSLYERAFSSRQYFLDLETTGDAQKTDKARIYQATLYRYDPANPGDKAKHLVTDDQHVLSELSKNGLEPGQALTFYFNLGKEPAKEEMEHGMVHLPSMGNVDVQVHRRDGNKWTKKLYELAYKGGTEEEVAKQESQAMRSIFGIFAKAWSQDPNGAVLNVHNSNFDFTNIQLSLLRDKTHKAGEEIMEYFPSGKTAKSSKRIWTRWKTLTKKKVSKEEIKEFYDRTKNQAVYRLYAESDSQSDSLVRFMSQRARVARRTKSIFERSKSLKEAQTAAEWFVEKHLTTAALHTEMPGSKGMIHDTMNVLKASNLLLQKHNYMPKRGNIALGTSLDLLSIARSGMPISHLESTDITKYADIVKNEYENILLPLLANGKLNLEGKRQIYVRERLMKLDNEKNIADSIFERYLEAINRQKIKVTGEIGLEPTQKKRIRVTPLDEIIEEQISFYTQPQTVRSSRVLDKPIRESLEAEHGKDTADIIQRYIEKVDKEYQKKYYHDMSVTELDESTAGEVLFRKKGYGSGEFKTVDYEAMQEIITTLRRDTKTTFKTLKTVVGGDLQRRSKAIVAVGLDPNKAGKVMDLFDYFRPAFVPIGQQVEELRAKAEQIKNAGRVDMSIFGVAAKDKIPRVDASATLISYLKRHRTNARTGLVVGGVLAMGALAAASRAGKMMEEDADQTDFQDRFDFYLNETGASVNAEGSEGYEGDVLSSEDKESYSGMDSLNIYERVLNTDFESPFRAPTVSLPMAQGKMANKVNRIHVDRPKIGYNVMGGPRTLSDLNKQAQVANHRRLQGHYNMLQSDYNLDG